MKKYLKLIIFAALLFAALPLLAEDGVDWACWMTIMTI